MQEELKLRINELAQKKESEGLLAEEEAEQAKLYRLYVDELKDQMKIALHQAGFEPKKQTGLNTQ